MYIDYRVKSIKRGDKNSVYLLYYIVYPLYVYRNMQKHYDSKLSVISKSNLGRDILKRSILYPVIFVRSSVIEGINDLYIIYRIKANTF